MTVKIRNKIIHDNRRLVLEVILHPQKTTYPLNEVIDLLMDTCS